MENDCGEEGPEACAHSFLIPLFPCVCLGRAQPGGQETGRTLGRAVAATRCMAALGGGLAGGLACVLQSRLSLSGFPEPEHLLAQ